MARELAGRSGVMAGVWPRAASLLARQSLEAAMADFWVRRGLDLGSTSTRAQLLCLPAYAGAETARQTSWTWWSLTRSCHYHPYELPPTTAELDGTFDAVDALLGRLAR
jgi:hypothetical protein